ncbi:ankyrin repeat-containing domain protein [Xylariaceae sp. AK1471]|nr:ankyrin repeat-containing domain protein [Xylariaceae sp. AK1471]
MRMAPSMYKYTPFDLATDTIRLVCLFKGYFNDDIQCELWESQLHRDDVPYEALSYTWGGTEKPAKITLGGSTAQVTYNLDTALRYLRFENRDRILWIDAICIDQDNEKERGHQVGQMRRIYQNAEKVLIWLGPGTYETDLLMDSINQVEKQAKSAGDDWISSSKRWQVAWPILGHELGETYATSSIQQRKGLLELLERPWFRRVWIIQEVASARTASVICGWKSVSAGIFAQIPSSMGMHTNHWQTILDIMPGHVRQKSWWSQNRDLRTLLVKFRDSEARDPRDNIYALLGISSDANENDVFRPDYEMSLQNVIQNTISFLLFRKLVDLSVYKLPKWTVSQLYRNLDGLSYEVFRWALKLGHNATSMRLLADSEIDVNKIYNDIGTPLSFLAKTGLYEVFEAILARDGVDVNLGEPLAKAAENGRDAIVGLLLARDGVDVNLGEPLAKAAENGRDAIVGLLLARNDVDVNLGEPLAKAAKNGHDAIVGLLLAPNDVNVNLGEPLVKAAIVRLLLARNDVDVNLGELLAKAAVNGDEMIVRLLLENGADKESRDSDGRTPLSLAAANSCEMVVRLLLEDGANKESRDNHGRTPLSWAADWWWLETAQFLLYKGADVESRDDYGRTPMSLTCGMMKLFPTRRFDLGSAI